MKLFISADIEGCAGVALTDETHKKESVYQRFAEEMTEEVVAACEAAHEAGADEIVVKDGHGDASNIDPLKMPKMSPRSTPSPPKPPKPPAPGPPHMGQSSPLQSPAQSPDQKASVHRTERPSRPQIPLPQPPACALPGAAPPAVPALPAVCSAARPLPDPSALS